MKKKKVSKRILIILLILFVALILLIAIDFRVWKYFEKKEIKQIPLIDQCSILFNNILHSIKDEASCENYCRSECVTRNKKFYNSDFSFHNESCNTCNCYCK